MLEVIRRTGLPRKRAATPRSRNGCIICTRRIKCDEGKPTCQRCTASGWKCGGYRTTSHVPTRSTILPRIANGESVTTRHIVTASPDVDQYQTHCYRLNADPLPPPSDLLFQNAEQYRYYQFFEEQTVGELSGVFSKNFWGHLVLRACHKERFVKHAVIAIAALTLSIQNLSTHSALCLISGQQNKVQEENHQEIALMEYGRALKLMRKTSPLDQDEATRNMLLACLLTYCFENIHGSTSNAVAQAQIGVTLLEKWINNETQKGAKIKARISPRPECIETELLCIFERLYLQLKAPQETQSLNTNVARRSRDLEALRDMPAIFVSSDQAKYYLELITRLAMTQRHLMQSRSVRIVSGDEPGHLSMLVQLDEISMERETASNHSLDEDCDASMLARFYAAFEPLLHRARSIEGFGDLLPTSMLLVQWTGLPFMTRSSFNLSSEMWYDSQLPAMKTCIDLLHQILQTMYVGVDSTSGTPVKKRFTFEAQYLPTLCGIAFKCRDWATRRKAFALLKRYPVIEGLGDSMIVAAIAKRCMELEEDGLAFGSYVPEEKRLKFLRHEIFWAERAAVLTCARLLAGTDKMEILPSIRIKW